MEEKDRQSNSKNINNYYINKYNNIYIKRTREKYPHRTGDLKHFHNTYELWYLLTGKSSAFVKDKINKLDRESILLIDKNTIHKILVKEKTIPERIVIEFKEDFLNEKLTSENTKNLLQCFKKNIYTVNLPSDYRLLIENNLFEIVEENKKQDIYYNYCILNLLSEILIYLNRIIENTSLIESNSSDESEDIIVKILKYIKNNYQKELSLEHISNKFYISKYYFSRQFKENTGFTFTEYINHRRIMEAQKILKNSDINVTKIAYKVGYNSISQFYRMFKRVSDLPPLQYRKQYKQNKQKK
ncbi:MAG: AraC family transcriptional regulator [Halanaerobiales bacterium]